MPLGANGTHGKTNEVKRAGLRPWTASRSGRQGTHATLTGATRIRQPARGPLGAGRRDGRKDEKRAEGPGCCRF
jgi:hypothetical protein